MAEAVITYTAKGRDTFHVDVQAPLGSTLRLTARLTTLDPGISGDRTLAWNDSLIESMLAYGKDQFQSLLADKRGKSDQSGAFRRAAEDHKKMAAKIATFCEQLVGDSRQDWCSGCFARSEHQRVGGVRQPSAFLCQSCGATTSPCAAPLCSNMANRLSGTARLPRYCAEHRHDIPSFERLTETLTTIDEYRSWLEFDKKNLARGTKIAAGVGLSAAAIGPMSLLAAPAIGGAIGSLTGLSGAAATSHGLALLGGGSLATGGLGMAGGTAVVAAAGAGLGGAVGATTTSAYVREDKSFRIEEVRDGTGAPVLIASGFLTEGQSAWDSWQPMIDARYPGSPVYQVHWGSKELKSLGSLIASAGSKQLITSVVQGFAKRSSRNAAKKLPLLGNVLLASSLIANPWTVAKFRADMTGAVLADIIARTKTVSFVLVGHSLGARVMATTADLLGTRDCAPRLESVHLLGAAVSSSQETLSMSRAVSDKIWNYYSDNDMILNLLYRIAELNQESAGSAGLKSPFREIRNVDVSRSVANHSEYVRAVRLR